MGKCVMCQHCKSWFFPEGGVSLDDCPKCGRTVKVQPAPAPSGWGIDTSAGREILVYDGCSVIEEEQARQVLAAMTATALPPGEVGASRALVRLGESTIGIRSEDSEIVADIRAALAHISDLTRRLADAEAAYKHVKQCLHISQGRAKRAEERIQELEDMRND